MTCIRRPKETGGRIVGMQERLDLLAQRTVFSAGTVEKRGSLPARGIFQGLAEQVFQFRSCHNPSSTSSSRA
jgi:hypothetical protein